MYGTLSLPTRERGLKRLVIVGGVSPANVAPYAGAWIETSLQSASCQNNSVAPYAGAWIET